MNTTNDLTGWTPRPLPAMPVTSGRTVVVAPFDAPTDAGAIFNAICGPENDDLWTYVPIGPFETPGALGATFDGMHQTLNWRTHLLRAPDEGGKAGAVLGMASFMRLRPDHGSAEIGCIVFSKNLRRRTAATEAMYLMARYIFEDLGYRRYEWKCDNANEASRRAAARFGFQFEGVFRQDMVSKGRNRDTAWFSITDTEWPALAGAYQQWLHPENFDALGQQRQTLSECRARLGA